MDWCPEWLGSLLASWWSAQRCREEMTQRWYKRVFWKGTSATLAFFHNGKHTTASTTKSTKSAFVLWKLQWHFLSDVPGPYLTIAFSFFFFFFLSESAFMIYNIHDLGTFNEGPAGNSDLNFTYIWSFIKCQWRGKLGWSQYQEAIQHWNMFG